MTMLQLTKDNNHKPLTLIQFQTKFPFTRHNIFAFLQAQACPFIRSFWNQVRDYATRHLVNYIPLSAAWALWGITPNIHTKITRAAKRLLLIITAVAKKTILQVWISTTPPTIKLSLEKLTFIEVIPQTIKVKLHECFQYTECYITRTVSGDPPINL
ncbi:hypothetical protein XELAEV_18012522mg [Xenopus laevis]|uniref:Uncharacterized protein n=1 Tax=Xenopus laevis TaxID=8355 RepID=A0A974DPM6_XENLA|nr:hypothetical protein XELAEV_18012522mg [Xenopus laevis]